MTLEFINHLETLLDEHKEECKKYDYFPTDDPTFILRNKYACLLRQVDELKSKLQNKFQQEEKQMEAEHGV